MRIKNSDVRWATDNTRMFNGAWNPNAASVVNMCLFEYKARGIRLVEKNRAALWPSYATNLSSRRLWVDVGFWDQDPRWQARTLAHELVHFRQREQHGDALFNMRYIFRARWRWRYEVQAYRETLRVAWAFHKNKTLIRKHAENIAKDLRRTYLLNITNNASVFNKTVSVLLQGIA